MKIAVAYVSGSIAVCDGISVDHPVWRKPTDEELMMFDNAVDITPIIMEDYNCILFDILESLNYD